MMLLSLACLSGMIDRVRRSAGAAKPSGRLFLWG